MVLVAYRTMYKLAVALVCFGCVGHGDGLRKQKSSRGHESRHLEGDTSYARRIHLAEQSKRGSNLGDRESLKAFALALLPLAFDSASAFNPSHLGVPRPQGSPALTARAYLRAAPLDAQIRHAQLLKMHIFSKVWEKIKRRLWRRTDTGTSENAEEFIAMSFYNISPVADPDKSVEEHRTFLTNHFITGRVYICKDGINAQVSGRAADITAYQRFVLAAFPSDDIIFTRDPVPEHAFPKLKVKHKLLVQSPEDLSQRGTHLSPEEWRDRLAIADSKPLKLLDVRNSYEWDVGRFKGANRPEVGHFRNTTGEALGLDEQDKNQDVLMYCTGGIRCEYYSAKLKREGFKNVYQLKGGIQNYGNKVGSEGWDGKLFVFDRRNTIPVGDGKTKVVGRCIHCGEPAEQMRNCCNIDCNTMHISCEACWEKHVGLCSPECHHSDRIRPWTFYVDGRPTKGLNFEQGPPPGTEDVNKGKFLRPEAPEVIPGVTPKGSWPRKPAPAMRAL